MEAGFRPEFGVLLSSIQFYIIQLGSPMIALGSIIEFYIIIIANIGIDATKIGNLLVGPGPGGAGGSVIRVSNNGPYNFTINPRTTLIKFNKLDSINFKLRWVSKSVLGDSIKVDVSNVVDVVVEYR